MVIVVRLSEKKNLNIIIITDPFSQLVLVVAILLDTLDDNRFVC